MIVAEYPSSWPTLVDEILTLLKSNDINSTHAALLCLSELFKAYKYSIEEEHKTILNNLVSRTFEVLIDLQQYLLQQQQDTSVNQGERGEFFAQMRLILAKIFWNAMNMGTPQFFFQNPAHFERWMQLFMSSVQISIPQQADDQSAHWKTIKWLSHVAYRLLSMYLHPTVLEVNDANAEATSKFSNFFLDKFAMPWLSIFVGMLDAYNKGEKSQIPKRILALALTFVHGVIQNQKLYDATLKSKLPYVIAHIVFPFLCFNAEDKELWESDPQEYQRVAFAVDEDMFSPKAAAASVIIDLVKVRKNEALPAYLAFINQELTQYNQMDAQHKNYPLKDGILFSIGSLRSQLRKAKQTKDSLEMMLMAHVFPEFENPNGFLRAKACWLLGQFSMIKWSNSENMVAALRKVLNCLNDNELPVKVQAGLALTDFLNNPDAMKEVKPILPQLLQVFLQNMNDMEHEKVVESIELLIDAFHDEMEPYAMAIISKMTETFLRLFDDDEEEEAEFVMAGCLRTIITLMGALHNKTHLFPQIERAVYPIVVKILESSNGMEYISEGLEILTNLTFYSQGPHISRELWQLFPMMGNIFKEYAYDYVYDFVAPIDNYVSKDPDNFLANPTNMEIVMYMINIFLSDDEAVEKESQSAVKMASILLQYLRGRIDNVMPKLLELIIGRLSKATTTALKILLLDAVGDALIYNTDLTLQFMEKTQCTTSVFGLWLTSIPKFQRLYDKKVTVLALSTLIGRDMTTLPSSIQSNIGQIITTCVRMLIQMRQQRIEEKQADEEAERDRQDLLSSIQNGYTGDDEDDDEDEDFQRQVTDDEDDAGGIDITGMQHSKAFKSLIAQLSNTKWDEQADDDELDEEEAFCSGVDTMDENIIFGSAAKAFAERYPDPMRQIGSSLNSEEQSAFQQLMTPSQ